MVSWDDAKGLGSIHAVVSGVTRWTPEEFDTLVQGPEQSTATGLKWVKCSVLHYEWRGELYVLGEVTGAGWRTTYCENMSRPKDRSANMALHTTTRYERV